jgi:hypothetical protein
MKGDINTVPVSHDWWKVGRCLKKVVALDDYKTEITMCFGNHYFKTTHGNGSFSTIIWLNNKTLTIRAVESVHRSALRLRLLFQLLDF